MSNASESPVLVTGGTGFLGQHLVHDLCEQGYNVRLLLRSPESIAARELPTSAERVKGDVLDLESLHRAAKGCKAIFHCAGKVSRDPNDALDMHNVHVHGTENALDAARKNGLKRFVLASTSGIVGVSEDSEAIATEDDEVPFELVNRWAYYRSKFYSEKLSLRANSPELEVICVNPSLLLGPGDRLGSSTEDVRRYLEQPLPIAPTGGVSFVDARDAATGMRLAYERGEAGERYLLTSCNCTVRTFLGRIARVAGLRAPYLTAPGGKLARRATVWLGKKARDVLGADDMFPDPVSLEMAYYYWYVDASKAENKLGWKPRDPMVTLLDTVRDLQDRGVVPLRSEPHPTIHTS